MGNPVDSNPLRSRADVEQAAAELLSPLVPLLSEGRAHLRLGESGAVFSDEIAQMEAFARPLWAIVPMLLGRCEAVRPFWEAWREGIVHGVDPAHPEYWGDVADYDQRLVEMAVFGTGMCLAPEEFFFSLPKKAQTDLYRWLDQINRHDMPKNNWIFFRVLVNIGFRVCGLAYPMEQLTADLAHIETHYEGDGWYFDYPDQRDYYTFWAFHYYGLVYSVAMRDVDPERAEAYRRRSVQVAKDYACWFDANGSALPYGRSLTYRFAQSAFFAAAAFAGAVSEEIDYGVLKHLMLQNLRNWLRKPVFTRDGVLTIGYGYPDLIMAEGYNAPGSPYWAMKTFLCLAMPDDHPFWTAEEKPYEAPLTSFQPHARMLVCRDRSGSHVLAYTAGNHAPEHAHDEAKYEKLVYSTVFGISVPKAGNRLEAGAFDSALAISPDGKDYRSRFGCETYEVTAEKVASVWSPYPGVTVETEVFPLPENWHVRIHHIHCEADIYAAEGGFAIAREGAGEARRTADNTIAAVRAPWGVSAIYALSGYERAAVIAPEPNTNLFTPRTYLPTLTAHLPAGTHTLVCAVCGFPDGRTEPILPQEVQRYAHLG